MLMHLSFDNELHTDLWLTLTLLPSRTVWYHFSKATLPRLPRVFASSNHTIFAQKLVQQESLGGGARRISGYINGEPTRDTVAFRSTATRVADPTKLTCTQTSEPGGIGSV